MNGDLYFNGKKYISAKRAAEVSGYVNDYISQLCRFKKLESKVVGRSWFVSEESLFRYFDKQKIAVKSSAEFFENKDNKNGEQKSEISEISSSRDERKTVSDENNEFDKIVEQKNEIPATSSSRDEENAVIGRSGEFVYMEDKGPLIPEIVSKESPAPVIDTKKNIRGRKKNILRSDDKLKSPLHKNAEHNFRKMLRTGAMLAVFVSVVLAGVGALNNFSFVKDAREKISSLPVDFLKAIVPPSESEKFYSERRENKVLALIEKTPLYFEAGLRSSIGGAANVYHSLAGKFGISNDDISSKIYIGANNLFSDVKNYFGGFFGGENKFADNEIIPIKQSEKVKTSYQVESSPQPSSKTSAGQTSSSSADSSDSNNSKFSYNPQPTTYNLKPDITRREVLDLIKQYDDSSKALIYAANAVTGENSLIVNQTVSGLENKINSLEQKGTRQIDHVYNSVSRSFSEITALDGVAMTNSSFSGTTISGTAGTFSGNLTVGSQLTVSGTATSTIAGDANFDSGTLYIDSVNNRVGIASSSPSETLSLNGAAYLAQISAPSVTTDRLYNASGDLYWNGNLISSASVGNWTSSGGNVYRSSGNVGIGTTSPNWKLSVAGIGSFDDNVRSSYFTATSTTATSTFPYLAVTTRSNLGTVIGGTWNGTAIGDAYLTKSGDWTGTLDTYNGSDLLARANHTGTQGVSTLSNYDLSFASNYGVNNLTSSTTMPLWAQGGLNASSTSNFVYASTTAFTISGNSYLGTVSSGAWNGTAVATQYGGTGINSSALTGIAQIVSGTWSASSTLAVAYGGTGWNAIQSGYVPFGNGSAAIATSTNFYWDNGNSRLGIGTTTPDSKLTVFASADDSAIEFSSASGSTYKWTMGMDYSDGGKFKIASSTALGSIDRFTIDGNGYVGIGTSTPARRLDVVDTANAQLRLSQGTTVYTDFSVAPTTGDLTLSLFPGASADDIFLTTANSTGANLWVCENSTCPTGISFSGGGNLFVEGGIKYATSTTPKTRRSIILTAAGAIVPATGGAAKTQVDGTNHSYYVLDFDASSDETAYWQWTMPDSYDDGAMDVTYYWEAGATTNDTIFCFQTKGISANNAEDIDQALSSAVCETDTAQGNANDLASATEVNAASNFTAGEYVTFKVFRDADAGGDTMTGDARLLKVKIEYGVSAESD